MIILNFGLRFWAEFEKNQLKKFNERVNVKVVAHKNLEDNGKASE